MVQISGKSDVIDIDVIVHQETNKAWLVYTEKSGKVWLPKSAVEMETTFTDFIKKPGKLTLPIWLAERNRLV